MTAKLLKARLVAMLSAGSILFFSSLMFLAAGNAAGVKPGQAVPAPIRSSNLFA